MMSEVFIECSVGCLRGPEASNRPAFTFMAATLYGTVCKAASDKHDSDLCFAARAASADCGVGVGVGVAVAERDPRPDTLKSTTALKG
eukprot:6853188-Prymnesium_polylepis.2